MKKFSSLFAIFLLLIACTKEEYKEAEDYVLPSITMDSCVVASDNSFTAYMTVDKGKSFSNHSVQLLVYDAKDVSRALSAINVELGEDRLQKLHKTFTVPVVEDQYIVSAVLKTEKNSFKSRSLFVSLAKMTAESYLLIWGQPRYQEAVRYEGRAYPYKHATDDIALHFSSSRHFNILVKAAMKDKPVEVRVGSHIYPVIWDGTLYPESEKETTDCTMEVTMTDIEPGIYDVALHWPEAELPLPKKIRILPLKAEEEETVPFSQFKDQPYDAKASFRIGDEMYYFTNMEFKTLVSCDLNTKTWTKHKDVDYDISEMVAIGSKAYGITEIFKEYGASCESVQNKLYEYNPRTDSWKDLGNLPVKGEIHNMKMFTAGGYVYVCGGQFPNDESYYSYTQCMEMWKYDISSGQWTRVADRPTEENVMQTGNGETNGYLMTPHGFLWVYDSNKDEWERVSQLTSVYLSNNWGQCLLEHDGKLFYVGHPGGTNIDNGNPCIYSYDFKTRQWELLGLYDVMTIGNAILTATFHNNKLVVGPFLKQLDYPGATCMHFFNFDLK
jgi:hypothetical protein